MPVRPTLLIETPDTAEGSRYLTLPGVDLDAGQARRLFMEYLTALPGPRGRLGRVFVGDDATGDWRG